MKAAVVTQTGVEIREVPAPVPGRNQVLVRVRACGLNRADLGVAAGHMHGTVGGPGTIVGMEFAGEVAEVGAEASAVKPGESVLIQGASSGVGLRALQIARHMGAAQVLGSSTNVMRREKLKHFGADLAIDTTDPAWPDAVLAATGSKGVHLIPFRP